jgi:hypothetical protein
LRQTGEGDERDAFQSGSARWVTGLQYPCRDRPRIALYHLESLVCLPAINALFGAVGDQISLVVLSNRFGGRHGGMARQLLKGIRRSGLRLTLWLGFDIVAAQWTATIARMLGVGRAELLSVRALAARHGAQVVETNDVNGTACLQVLEAHSPDIILVLNFDQILRQPVIGASNRGIVNVHPSLLPAFRGPCPVFWAMAEGRRELGVSVHLIEDQEIDAGPVIAQASVIPQAALSVAEATSVLFLRGTQLLIARLNEDFRSQSLAQERSASTYQTFPTRAEVYAARVKGMRFWRWEHLVTLLLRTLLPLSSLRSDREQGPKTPTSSS